MKQSNKVNLAAPLQKDSILDGEGIRTVIWMQGCAHACPFCHNPGTHSFEENMLCDIKDIEKQLDELEMQDGITLSGGDPLYQIDSAIKICNHAKKINLNVWVYTGFTYEEVLKMDKGLELLKLIDVLVDGPFINSLRSLDLPFRGSTNQRVIDVRKSLKNKKVEEIKFKNEGVKLHAK